jgi:hypothetical protein
VYRQGDGGTWEYLTEPKKGKQQTSKQKIAAAKLILAAEKWRLRNATLNGVRVSAKGIKKVGRERKLHFVWKKGSRLTLCLGGTAVAAWPGADDGYALALVQTKMVGEHIEPLSSDQGKVRAMALRLREALMSAEEGPRRKSAHRQRARVDQLFKLGVYRPARKGKAKVRRLRTSQNNP